MSLKFVCAVCGEKIDTGVYCNRCQNILLEKMRRISAQKGLQEQVLMLEEEHRRNNLILIADENIQDSEIMAEIISENITTHGVIVLNDFDKIINALHSLKVRLALINDSVSINFNGLKILRAIRDDYVIGNTPVIITANKNDEDKKFAAMNLEARYYIVKPFDFEKLTVFMNEILAEEQKFITALSKILVIDDNEDDMEIEKAILEDCFHCTVYTADGGISGVEILQNAGKVDLILVSLQMSFMNGFRVLKFFGQNGVSSEIPIVFMNNKKDKKTLDQIKSSFAAGYINKPNFSSKSLSFIKQVLMKGS